MRLCELPFGVNFNLGFNGVGPFCGCVLRRTGDASNVLVTPCTSHPAPWWIDCLPPDTFVYPTDHLVVELLTDET